MSRFTFTSLRTGIRPAALDSGRRAALAGQSRSACPFTGIKAANWHVAYSQAQRESAKALGALMLDLGL